MEDVKSTDIIADIGINDAGRLHVKPKQRQFTLTYRSATEVHWDNEKKYLYSPKPREWTYLMWYKHIISVIETDYNCELKITPNTNWYSVPTGLNDEIVAWESKYFSRR